MGLVNPARLGIRSTSSQRAGPPTSTLPPLTHLATHTTEQVKQSLQNLHYLYFPPEAAYFYAAKSKLSIPKWDVSRPVYDTSVPDSGYASAEEEGGNFQSGFFSRC